MRSDLHGTGLRKAIPAHLDGDRPRPARQHHTEGFGHYVGHVLRPLDACRPFGQAAQGRQLIGNFMQSAAAFADRCRRDLPGDAEHRCIGRPSGDEGRAGIENAGPRHDGIDAGTPGGFGVAQGHVGRSLLVTHAEGSNIALQSIKRVEYGIGLRTRQAEDCVDAIGDQRADDSFAGAHEI